MRIPRPNWTIALSRSTQKCNVYRFAYENVNSVFAEEPLKSMIIKLTEMFRPFFTENLLGQRHEETKQKDKSSLFPVSD